jgi:hypothetical protein
MDVAELAITSAVAVIGLYLAHSFSRQQRLKIAEQRVEAYRKLWTHMLVARPTRLEPPEQKGPLTAGEAAGLYGEVTTWYFDGGNGMLLPTTPGRCTSRRSGAWAGTPGRTGQAAPKRPGDAACASSRSFARR